MPSRILGIDPGFDRFGIAVVEGTGTKQTLLYSECVVTNTKDAHEKRLLAIGDRLAEVIHEWKPGALAIEKLFFNQNVSTGLKVAEARGVALLEAAQAGIAAYEYSPQDVKIAVTGFGKADKKAVEAMVRRLVKVPDGRKVLDDELDAIALCITHLATARSI